MTAPELVDERQRGFLFRRRPRPRAWLRNHLNIPIAAIPTTPIGSHFRRSSFVTTERGFWATVTGIAAVMATAVAAPADDPVVRSRIERVLERTPLIDGHNDLPAALMEKFGAKLWTRGPGRERGQSDHEVPNRHRATAAGPGRRPVLVRLGVRREHASRGDQGHPRADRHRPRVRRAISADVRHGRQRRGHRADPQGPVASPAFSGSRADTRSAAASPSFGSTTGSASAT